MDLMGDNTSLWLSTNVTILITTKNSKKKEKLKSLIPHTCVTFVDVTDRENAVRCCNWRNGKHSKSLWKACEMYADLQKTIRMRHCIKGIRDKILVLRLNHTILDLRRTSLASASCSFCSFLMLVQLPSDTFNQ